MVIFHSYVKLPEGKWFMTCPVFDMARPNSAQLPLCPSPPSPLRRGGFTAAGPAGRGTCGRRGDAKGCRAGGRTHKAGEGPAKAAMELRFFWAMVTF